MVPSVQYGDFLAVTLPGWRAMFPTAKLVVVTSPEDLETQEVARRNGADVVETKAWYRGGRPFDKAAALDEAFGFTERRTQPKEGERCLAIDADVYPFGKIPSPKKLQAETIYGCPRYVCNSQADLEAHIAGTTTRDDLDLMMPRRRGVGTPAQESGAGADLIRRAGRAALGFFQLFLYSGQRFGSFPSAGGYDIAFRNAFPHRGHFKNFYVLHLGESTRKNWKGRIVPAWGATA